MAQVSGQVRAFIISRILDQTSGFNYWVGQLAGSIDYPNVAPFSIDLSTTLFEANIDEKQIDNLETDYNYPLIIVKSDKGNAWEFRVTPSEYSGPVTTIVDFYAGYIDAALPPNTEQLLDMVEDAMMETFNAYSIFELWQGNGFSYNNNIAFQRGTLLNAGPGWRQKERFIITVNLPDQQPR